MNQDHPLTEDDLREMVLRLAHEIRNPLATIQSAVQLLEHLQQPEGDEKEFFESIYVEVSRIDNVVRDMHRFARLDVHTATSFTIKEAVQAAIEALSCRASTDAAPINNLGGPRAVVLMDRNQLEEAIGEVLSNALTFSPAGSEVRIAWRLAEAGIAAIDIDDLGPGIPEDLQNRILRPFFSSSTHGTGLGLNIVARTCRLNGGRLEWRNRKRKGARFSLFLPILRGGDHGAQPRH